MSDERDGYQAYLLRLWRVRYQGRWQWRASINSPHTGERHNFARLGGLFTFLEDRTRQETPRSGVERQDLDGDSIPGEEQERHDV